MTLSQGSDLGHPFADDGVQPGAESFVNERWSEIPVLPDSYCMMFFGERGSGKSAVMAKCLKDEAALGKPVWYWPPDYKFKYGQPIDALTLYSLPDWLRDGAVGIDEIQVLLNRLRTVSTANIMGGAMLQQLRKRGLNFYGTSNQPGRVDETVALQTDFHFFCERIEDHRCKERGYHMRSCDDHIRMRYVDTNRKFGPDPRYYDGRKRGRAVVWKIRDVYGAYNTGAIADLAEVVSITKASIIEQKEESTAKIKTESLVETLRTKWIPWAVAEGHKSLAVSAFRATINEKFGLNVSNTMLGTALKELGLGSKSNGTVRVVTLPPMERLEDWRKGLWLPD